MNHRSLFSGLVLLLALPGCGASFYARGPQLAVSAPSPFAVAVAGAAIDAASQPPAGLNVGLDARASANVTASASQPSSNATQLVVAQITGLTVHAAGQGARVQPITGGAVALEVRGSAGLNEIVGGDLEIDASAVEGTPCAVTRGTVTLASGARYDVSGGRVTLARNREGRWIISTGRITTVDTTVTTATTVATSGGGGQTVATGGGAGGGAGVAAVGTPAQTTTTTRTTTRTTEVTFGRVTGVDVGRVAVGDGGEVLAGGEIAVAGAPNVQGLTLVDGRLDFEDDGAGVGTGAGAAGSRTARVAVRATTRRAIRVRAGGTVLVGDGHGRRWRARVEGGELVARTEGTNPGGSTVWEPTGGELRVTVLASGGDGLTLQGDGLPDSHVALSARVMGALDALVGAVPASSAEAARLAAAVEVVVRNTQSAEPAFYAIPVRGRSLVLMVDISYSMSDPDPQAAGLAGGASKLDVARAELVKVLASAPAGVQVDVVAFSSQVHTMWAAPRVVDDASLAEAVRWVAALRPADETHPLEAMQAASAMNPEQIVMLSDGRPSDSEAVLRRLVTMVDGIAARTRVDVVGFGADQDRAFLGNLAAHGHGTLRLR